MPPLIYCVVANLWTLHPPQPPGPLLPPALPFCDQQKIGGLGAYALPGAFLQDLKESVKMLEEDYAICLVDIVCWLKISLKYVILGVARNGQCSLINLELIYVGTFDLRS